MRQPRPDFLIIGAPKAGTTALHAALAQHPQIFVTDPKEPKFWLCDDAPPPHWTGPGDAHSQQEWIWRRDDYAALFASAPEHAVRGESTPFYLWSRSARRRIAEALPDVRLIAVVRDPIDRAYSNWMHLWCDGLEPDPSFLSAYGREAERIASGHAPFWRYRELGCYGEQLADLLTLVDRERVLVLRYRELVDDPAGAIDRACRFLGVAEGVVREIPRDNARHYVAPGLRTRLVGPAVRAGAWAGQFARPELWRAVSPHLIAHLGGRHEAHRPHLTPEERGALIPGIAEDVALLAETLGEDFSDWTSTASRGSFDQRRALRG